MQILRALRLGGVACIGAELCGGVRRGVQSLQLNDKACIRLAPAKFQDIF